MARSAQWPDHDPACAWAAIGMKGRMRDDFLIFGCRVIGGPEIAEVVATLRAELAPETLLVKIETAVHYSALHLHACYRRTFGCRRGDFRNVEYIGDRTLSLLLSGTLTDADIADVVNAVRTVCTSSEADRSLT